MKNNTTIELIRHGVDRDHEFAHVPLPQGWSATGTCFVLTDERDIPISCKFLEGALWPDKSIRWLHIS
ncbi:hypothetical protein OAF47_01635, partial [bacterium]|nr:hypothetical protein [bacterium]